MPSLPQTEMFPEFLYLRRVDTERNMQRFYWLRVERDLFGQWFLVREWGRIGSAGKTGREQYPSIGPALDALSKAAKAKKKRGYVEM